MAKKKDHKKKGKDREDQPTEKVNMGKRFDKAMTKIANEPWPLPKEAKR